MSSECLVDLSNVVYDLFRELLKIGTSGDLRCEEVHGRESFVATDEIRWVLIDGKVYGFARWVKVLHECFRNEFDEVRKGVFIIQELKRHGKVDGYVFIHDWYSSGYEGSEWVCYSSTTYWFISDKPITLVIRRDYYDSDPEWASKWRPYTYRKQVEPRPELFKKIQEIFPKLWDKRRELLKEIKECEKDLRKGVH